MIRRLVGPVYDNIHAYAVFSLDSHHASNVGTLGSSYASYGYVIDVQRSIVLNDMLGGLVDPGFAHRRQKSGYETTSPAGS